MRAARLLVVAACSLLCVTGCRALLDFEAPVLAEDATPVDALVTDSNTPDGLPDLACMEKWRTGTVVLTTPAVVTATSSPSVERDPYLSRNGLSLYFGSNRTGSMGVDVWVTTRSALDQPFGTAPSIVLDLRSADDDSKIGMTADELVIFIASDRAGGEGNADIWMATRTSTANAFGTFSQTLLTAVNDGQSQLDPHISGDGLRLYFAPTGGPQHLELATRASTSSAFTAPVQIASVNSGTIESDPTLSDDERVIVFASDRQPKLGTGRGDLWYANRANADDPFGTAIHLVDISSTSQDGDASLSTDGCELFFGSDRSGNFEIYVSKVVLP